MNTWTVSYLASSGASSSFFSLPRRCLRQLVLGSISGWLLGGAVLAQAEPGALTQLGCISTPGNALSNAGCTLGRGLDGANSVTVSPDGKYAYVASYYSGAVTVFARDKKTGTLTQLEGVAGCISRDGDGVNCAEGRGLEGAGSVVMSPDDKYAYVTSFYSEAVAVFRREK